MALRKTQSHTRPQPPQKKAPGKGGPGFAYRQEGTNELSAPCGAKVSYQKRDGNATPQSPSPWGKVARPVKAVTDEGAIRTRLPLGGLQPKRRRAAFPPPYRKLFTQFTSESCHTLSATSRRIWSVTGPFFASLSSMALCNSATVISS